MDQLLKINPVLFSILFVGVWCLVSVLLSAMGGWSRIAKQYPECSPFSGEKWRMQSIRVGPINYNGCVTIGANWTAIFLSVLFPFRLGHPPLVIPYSEIVGKEVYGMIFKYVELTFRQQHSTTLRLTRKQADRIEMQSNGAWIYERT